MEGWAERVPHRPGERAAYITDRVLSLLLLPQLPLLNSGVTFLSLKYGVRVELHHALGHTRIDLAYVQGFTRTLSCCTAAPMVRHAEPFPKHLRASNMFAAFC